MATARHLRVFLLGSAPSGPYAGEIWQTGISFVEGDAGGVFAGAVKEGLPEFDVTVLGGATSDATWDIDWAWEGTSKVTQANQVGIANLAVTLFNAVKGQMTSNLRMDAVKINACTADGKVINGANYFQLKTPIAGTAAASSSLPAQLAVVASLRTGARGPGGRGRMYWPFNNVAGSAGVVGSTAQQVLREGVRDFCEDVRAIGPLAAVVNVAPVTYSAVTAIDVGNLYDSQRRRRNAIAETFTSATVTL